MKILTDYEQWYDRIFDENPPFFHRLAFTRGGLSKRAQFELFRSLNLPTPLYGTVSELMIKANQNCLGCSMPKAIQNDLECIVYVDEYAHRGEGKVRMSLQEAGVRHPQQFASMFVAQPGAPVAFRLIRFGQWAFWLRQEGQGTAWQSNRLDQENVLEKIRCHQPNPILRVLWAIDFVPSERGLLAVDFNTAPQLATLGESQVLSPEEIAAELHEVARTAPAQLRQF